MCEVTHVPGCRPAVEVLDSRRDLPMSQREIIPYDPRLKPLARRLRKQMTDAERRLWSRLRRKQVRGYSFYRQRPVDRFIVDFYCPDLKLAIEVDGLSHDEPGAHSQDVRRQRRLENLGVHVLRFRNQAVLEDLENVLRAIDGWIVEQEERGSSDIDAGKPQ